jgi:carboxypeptidase C (cathepsin A)
MSDYPSSSRPDTDAAKPADAERAARQRVDALLARSPVTSEGAVDLASGARLHYRVHAGFLPVFDSALQPKHADPLAAVLTTAYLVQQDAPRPRAVCFVLKGGPGSASVWLHLGALGPQRVRVNDDGSMPAPPFAVQPNPLTWLAHFDLVFIDPPHTGWSLAAGEEARKQVLSVDGDVAACVEVIRLWLARHGRFGSALYLAGESYGTTRSAAVADQLAEAGIALSGLILVSCAMDFQSFVFAPGNDLPYALFLPAYANVAQYHGQLKGPLGASSQAARAAAEAFVNEDYLAALHQGARLDGRARGRIEKRLAELTGLPQALVAEKNLRIRDEDFFFELLRPQGRQLGRLEARVSAPLPAQRDRSFEFDPGSEALAAPYAMAAQAYYAELGLTLDARYHVINMEVNKAWDWRHGGNNGLGYVATSAALARVLRRNPHLKVLVASGRYDLGTPYSASDWSLAQLNVGPEVMARVSHKYYDAGHMMYTREADLRQLKADLAAWMA